MTSREEYLKKYLSGGDSKDEKKKKKRLKKKIGENRIKIIEDDVDIPVAASNPEKADEIEELDSEDDDVRPVVELINNETDELKLLGKFQTENWKSIEEKGNTPTTSSRLRHDSADTSPPLLRQRFDSEDMSSLRRHDVDSGDISPPRRRRHDSGDASPPRRGHGHGSPDPSPPRRRQGSGDVSPARPVAATASRAPAEPVVIRRNIRRKGKEPTEEQKKRSEEMTKKYAVWNKGQKQVQEREQKLAELAVEASKPFARHEGDEDLEEHLKNIEYAEDPMFQYMQQKKQQETGAVSKPSYKGPWAPNRYSIPPGYRWDGVDRSNGFEVKLMALTNVKKAEEEEYYKWSSGRFE